MDGRFFSDILDSKKQKRVVVMPRNHGKSMLKDRMIEYQSYELAKRIDFEVLASALVSCGWTKINIVPSNSVKYDSIVQWTLKNCISNHRCLDGTWLFEDPRDATIFQLRWA
jgi:hypothetical protein